MSLYFGKSDDMLNNDVISRRDVVYHLQRTIESSSEDGPYNLGFIDGLTFALNHASFVPPVTSSTLKRSDWVRDEKRFGDNNVRCSGCGAILEGDELKWRNNYYCYHCGAEMQNPYYSGKDD